MKKISYAFLIMDLVVAIIACLFCAGYGAFFLISFDQSQGAEALATSIPFITFGVALSIASAICLIPIILNSIGIHQLRYADSKRDFMVVAIFLIILGNPISGITMLCIKDEELV